MKKLLLVLLVVALASFLFVGCLPTTPDEGEDEGEGEGECEVAVVIEGAVVIDDKTYVSGGNHTITVTFCAPVVGGVTAYITDCTGDYRSKDGSAVVLFPNADRTIWTGSGDFGYGTGCCASYVEVASGECADEVCIWFPVIVDSCDPFAEIKITSKACDCEGCEITFASTSSSPDCADDILCCDDTCSGLASWSMELYDGYPFDVCCDPSACEEPIGTCSGEDCPIACTTECLDAGTYYAIITLVDEVGNETIYYAKIILSSDCTILVYEGLAAIAPDCVDFADVTTDTIGTCAEVCVVVD